MRMTLQEIVDSVPHDVNFSEVILDVDGDYHFWYEKDDEIIIIDAHCKEEMFQLMKKHAMEKFYAGFSDEDLEKLLEVVSKCPEKKEK